MFYSPYYLSTSYLWLSKIFSTVSTIITPSHRPTTNLWNITTVPPLNSQRQIWVILQEAQCELLSLNELAKSSQAIIFLCNFVNKLQSISYLLISFGKVILVHSFNNFSSQLIQLLHSFKWTYAPLKTKHLNITIIKTKIKRIGANVYFNEITVSKIDQRIFSGYQRQ